MLEFAVLGLLCDTSLHGYEIKRRLAELGFWRVSFGSLYPGLKRLDRRGLIESDREGRKKMYTLTTEGQKHFMSLLMEHSDAPEEERHFHLRLAFFRYLDAAHRTRSLLRRRNELVEKLTRTKRLMRRAANHGRGKLDRYTRALIERGVRTTEADIAWLDHLIAAERGEQACLTATELSPGGAL